MRAVPGPGPVVAAAIGKKCARKKKAPLAVAVRGRPGERMAGGLFAAAFGAKGM
jgi:hypothetical protein